MDWMKRVLNGRHVPGRNFLHAATSSTESQDTGIDARSTMAGDGSEIVIIYATDGLEWALFIQRKLISEEYNIKTSIQEFQAVKTQALSSYKVSVVLLSPQLMEGALTSPKWDFGAFDKSSSVWVLLGVNAMEIRATLGSQSESVFQCQHEPICQDDPGKSLSSALVAIIKLYERDESFEDDTFADDDVIYQHPPSPRQINKIHRLILPPDGATHRDVLLLLDRPADGDVVIDLQTDPPTHIPATLLDKAVYEFPLPESCRGDVGMTVSSKEQTIAEDVIAVQNKLSQLNSLLQTITNPLTLMCQALGLATDTSELLDEALANQIHRQCSPQLVQMFQMFETNVTEKCSDHEWPTLPHFIAEFNLLQTFTELKNLQSTSIAIACCIQNCNGDYPCNIAERKGYNELAELLVNVVTEYKDALDSGVVSDIPLHTPPGPCGPHYQNHQVWPVEGELDTESPYMDMGGLMKELSEYSPAPCRPKKDPMKPRSKSDGDAQSRISFMNPEYTTGPHASEDPPSPGPFRPVSEDLSSCQMSPPETPPKTTPPPFLPSKRVPATPPKPSPKPGSFLSSSYSGSSDFRTQQPQKKPRTISEAAASRSDEGEEYDDDYLYPPAPRPTRESMSSFTSVTSEDDIQGNPKDTQMVAKLYGDILRGRSASAPQGQDRASSEFSFQSEEDDTNESESADQLGSLTIQGEPSLREKTKRGLISSFINRVRKKRQPRETDSYRKEKPKKKTMLYSRSGRGSDPGLSGMSFKVISGSQGPSSVLKPRKMSLPAVLEPPEGRDSGSYSEEEGNTDINYRKKHVRVAQLGKKMSLERKKSVRVSRAMNERISDAPSMPQGRPHFPPPNATT